MHDKCKHVTCNMYDNPLVVLNTKLAYIGNLLFVLAMIFNDLVSSVVSCQTC